MELKRKEGRIELEPEKLDLMDRYGLMVSVIQPRPIAWVSTQSVDGKLNLAPFSFFTGITANPMSICFAPTSKRTGEEKDTLINIEQTKQFVVNIASEHTVQQMNQTSADYPYGVSEFKKVGLTQLPSIKVKPPGVKESPVNLECELIQVVRISQGVMGGNLVIGKILYVHVWESVWKDNKIFHADLKPIGRLEGAWYTKISNTFEMSRPKVN